MKRNFVIYLFASLLFFPFCGSSQTRADSLCCLHFKVDTSSFAQLAKISSTLNEINPSFLSNTLSLMENVDINLLEKYYFFQKIGKHLKFEVAKKIFAYENQKMTYGDSMEYHKQVQIDDFLHIWITKYAQKLDECLETDEGKRFVQKKNLILQNNQNYFNEKISYDNSTYDLARKKYEKLIQLEDALIVQLENKMFQMRAADSIRSKKDKNYILMQEIVQDSKVQKRKYEENKLQLAIDTEKKFHPINQGDPLLYVVKKVLVMKDSSIFQITKGVQEQVIILNNVMYVFKNDSLVKKVEDIARNATLSAFNAYKPLSVNQVPGTFYTIQIGTYSREKLLQELKVSTNVFYKQLPDGKFRYSFGVYKSMADVDKAKKLLKTIGYSDVVLTAYSEGENIAIEEAKKVLK
jgi:hypothetical protein